MFLLHALLGFLSAGINCLAQVTVRIVPEKSGIHYSELSSDGKYLVVSQMHDTLRVLDARSFGLVRLIPFKSSENGMRSWEEIGKADFTITNDNRLIYIDREFKADSALLWLNTVDLAQGSLSSRVRIGGYRQPAYSTFDVMPAYAISRKGSVVLVTMDDQILAYDHSTNRILYKTGIAGVVESVQCPNGSSLAVVARDSLLILDDRTAKRRLAVKSDISTVSWLNDTLLMLSGKQAVVFDLKHRRPIDTLVHPFDRIGHASMGGGMVSLSGSGYYDHGSYAAVFAIRPRRLNAIFHLPAKTGFNTLITPNQQLWCLLADGRLFRFSLKAELNPRPVSQRGHKSDIRSFRFSSDGRQMVSTERGGDIIIWDVPTGRTIDRYITDETLLDDAFFSSDNQDVLYHVYSGYRRMHRGVISNPTWGLQFNAYSDRLTDAEALAHKRRVAADSAAVSRMMLRHQTDPESSAALSEEYFAGILKTDGLYRLRVVQLKTGLTEDRPLPDNLFSYQRSYPMAFYDSHTLVMQGAQSTIIFYDIPAGQVVRRFGGKYQNLGQIFNGVQKLVFSAAGDTLFAVTNQRTIQGWDLRSGERFLKLDIKLTGLTQDEAMTYQNGYFTLFNENSNIQFVAAIHLKSGRGKMIAYLDTAFRQRVQQVELAAHKAKGIPVKASLSPDARRMLILRRFYIDQQHSEEYADLWDLDQMKVVVSTRVPDLSYSAWSVSWEHKMVAIWDVNATSAAEQKEMRDAFGDNSAVGGLNTHPGIKIIQFEKGKVQELNLDKLKVTRAGDVLFNDSREIWLRDDMYSRLYRVSLATGKVLAELKPDASDVRGSIGDYLRIANGEMYYTIAPDNFHTTTEFTRYSMPEHRIAAQAASGGPRIMSMSEPHKSGVLALGYDDYSISIRDAKTLDEKYRIVQNEAGQFVILTGDQYYMADRSSANSIYFNWKNRSVALSQFDAVFNRPDKVLQAMGFLDAEHSALLEKAARKRGKLAGVGEINADRLAGLPEVRIEQVSSLPVQTSAERVKIHVSGTSSDMPLAAWQIQINGVPFFGHLGRKIVGGRSFQETVEIPLSIGENFIRVTCTNTQGVESVPDEVKITRSGRKVKPDLYLAAIAINEYRDSSFNLKYAVKDARDLIRFFSTSPMFSNVHVDSLFNQKVDLNGVRSLKERLKVAGPDDMVMVFVAGHGMLDENFDFRFASWAVDMNHPAETGILYDELEQLLDGIPCRNKLLLIDACHSGEVDKDEIQATAEDLITKQNAQGRVVQRTFKAIQHNVFKSGLVDRRGFELMQEIFYGLGSVNGSQVVVATAGDSYAQESAEWNNGVFTYALLSGLKSGSADLNSDKTVTTDELVSYLREKVKDLTNGDQVPRFREENMQNHFVIWQVR